ncbi:MAG: hypothetical protein JNL82_21320 [Myxococcales bacterium]|nr:hypothetical protein [Myxococcales bacterium]
MRPLHVVPALALVVLPAVAAAEPADVFTGAYAYAFSDIDLQAGTFHFDGYIWFRWRCDLLGEADFDFVLVNGAVDSVDAAPVNKSAGWCRQSRRLRATMRAGYELHDYPFDQQLLTLRLEHRWYGTDRMRFVPDDGAIPAGAGPREAFLPRDVDINQWHILDVAHHAEPYHYETDFGSIEKGVWDGLSSRYTFAVRISRPFFPYILKVVMPLMIIVGMAFLAFAIRPGRFDSKVSLLVTALLSTVALHLTQASALPEVGYLVRADVFFLISYAALGASLLIVTVEHRRSEPVEPDAPVRRAFIYARTAVIAAFFLSVALVVLT